MTHPSQRIRTNRPSRRRTARHLASRQRSIWVLLILLLLWSLCLGIGLAQATEPLKPAANLAQGQPSTAQPSTSPDSVKIAAIGTVDTVPERYKLGQQLYLKNCATCHIALSPAVLPSQTWRSLLQDTNHYGTTLQPLDSLEVQIVWQYLRDYSRLLGVEEQIPYRVYQSSYFKALHPRVKFSERVSLTTCISCHPGAGAYDFRSLSAEWQNAP